MHGLKGGRRKRTDAMTVCWQLGDVPAWWSMKAQVSRPTDVGSAPPLYPTLGDALLGIELTVDLMEKPA